jgi:hypothetical protein
MANSVGNVFVEGFDRRVRQLAQQSRTRLVPYVETRGSSAQNENWERLGATEFAAKASRGAATPIANVPWSRRVSGNAVYDAGELIGKEDITQMLADPNSNIAQSFAMGANRSQDDRIIAAATGTALDGQGAANPFPDSQKVTGDDIADSYSADISFDLVTKVVESFLNNDIDPETRKVAVVGPAQMKKLLQTTEATNQDYAQKALMNGFVNDWLGLDWIVSTRLNSPGANQRDCFVMTQRAIGMQMNADIMTQIAKDPSASFDWRLYTCWQGGAVRVEDEQIVWMQVSE